jgi:hypothetical protein
MCGEDDAWGVQRRNGAWEWCIGRDGVWGKGGAWVKMVYEEGVVYGRRDGAWEGVVHGESVVHGRRWCMRKGWCMGRGGAWV